MYSIHIRYICINMYVFVFANIFDYKVQNLRWLCSQEFKIFKILLLIMSALNSQERERPNKYLPSMSLLSRSCQSSHWLRWQCVRVVNNSSYTGFHIVNNFTTPSPPQSTRTHTRHTVVNDYMKSRNWKFLWNSFCLFTWGPGIFFIFKSKKCKDTVPLTP